MKYLFFIGLWSVSICQVALADTIYLKSGKQVEGTIVAKTVEKLILHTTIGLDMTYYFDEIERVQSDTSTVSIPSTDNKSIAPSKESAPSPSSSEIQAPPAPESNPKMETFKNNPTLKKVRAKGAGYINEQDRILSQWDRELQERDKGGKEEPITYSSDEFIYGQFDEKIALAVKNFDLWLEEFNKTHPRILGSFPGIRQLLTQIKGQNVFIFLSRYFPILYLSFCFPLMVISWKLKRSGLIWSWVPILHLWLMVKLANQTFVIFLGLFIPIVNLFIFIVIWMDIIENLKRPRWLGILMIVPGINILLLWYLAFSKIR